MRTTKQKGYTLVEMMLVMGLIVVATLLSFFDQQTDLEQARAKELGVTLYQYNNAVRAWLASNQSAGSGARVGSLWLKPTRCGGSSTVEYLPCTFPDASATNPISFGRLTLTSQISSSVVSGKTLLSVTTTTNPLLASGKLRTDLAGLAAIAASAGSVDTTVPLMPALEASYKSDALTGIITMVSSNSIHDQAWLRTDGTNTMNAPLSFTSTVAANARQISNVSRIQALAAEVFYLGNSGGGAAGYSMVVDADETSLGALVVYNQRNLTNAIQVAKGDIQAAAGGISASANVSATGSVTATSNVVAGGILQAQVFYDANNTAYMLDPSATSRLYQISADGAANFGNRVQANEYLQLNASVVQNTACASNGLVSHDATGKLLNCSAGIWQGASRYQGTYLKQTTGITSLTDVNNTSSPLFVTAWGGNGQSPSSACYQRSCSNPCFLAGIADGKGVAQNANNNNTSAKYCHIGFWVSPGQAFQVVSTPYSNESSGWFTMTEFGKPN